ncbi:PadR family transcriptional regulator [Pseudonocardiaceae bacterium YIM PH 21723]|nr:PadR family transcriptional regulator [Pseudonocardiaceae bacterium YIM PH 21723]
MSRRELSEQSFLVLSALTREPLHGYRITQEVEELSGGRVRLRVGTLYGALDRLAGDGLIELDREEILDGRLRRYYRLTDAGATLLADEARRLSENARIATERLGLRAFMPLPGGAA